MLSLICGVVCSGIVQEGSAFCELGLGFGEVLFWVRGFLGVLLLDNLLSLFLQYLHVHPWARGFSLLISLIFLNFLIQVLWKMPPFSQFNEFWEHRILIFQFVGTFQYH